MSYFEAWHNSTGYPMADRRLALVAYCKTRLRRADVAIVSPYNLWWHIIEFVFHIPEQLGNITINLILNFAWGRNNVKEMLRTTFSNTIFLE